MVLELNYSRYVAGLRPSNRARISAGIASVIALHLISASSGFTQSPASPNDGKHAQPIKDCPPEDKPPQNCDDVRRMAYKSAVSSGYADKNKNGTPDVMERPYRVDYNDCSTGNAHMACMYNSDPCLSKHGKVYGLRSNSASHMTVLYEGKDGKTFECDFTPQSSGIFIKNRRDTMVGTAYPDAGESIDPQYEKDGCPTNGASSSALNPGGGGGGGGGGSIQDILLAAIIQLLRQQQNQNNTNDNQVVTPTPTATPTPQPTSTPNTRSAAEKFSTEASDAAIVSALKTAVDDTDEKAKVADWETKREGLF